MDVAKRLKEELRTPYSLDTRDSHVQMILSSYEKALRIIGCNDQIRVSCESGLEGPHEDGFKCRKYGQKDILSAKHPRSYYRCTFRNTQNWWATKQVQRSDEDPTIFDITYRGKQSLHKLVLEFVADIGRRGAAAISITTSVVIARFP